MNTDSQRLSAGLLSAVLLVVVTGAAVAQVPQGGGFMLIGNCVQP
jgi:hypothetical protein